MFGQIGKFSAAPQVVFVPCFSDWGGGGNGVNRPLVTILSEMPLCLL